MTKIKKEYIHYSSLNQLIKEGDRVFITNYWKNGGIRGRVIGFTKEYVKCMTEHGWQWNKKPDGVIVLNDNNLAEF